MKTLKRFANTPYAVNIEEEKTTKNMFSSSKSDIISQFHK